MIVSMHCLHVHLDIIASPAAKQAVSSDLFTFQVVRAVMDASAAMAATAAWVLCLGERRHGTGELCAATHPF